MLVLRSRSGAHVINPLATKLSSFADLSDDDRAALDQLCLTPRSFKAGKALIEEGARPDHVQFLVEGWAFRYKLLPSGRRQVLGYLIPGDLCDVHMFILKKMDHSIGLLSDARVAAIPKDVMLDIVRQRPTIARALWWITLVDEATLRQWLVNIGQKDAYGRLAHLFCEMWLRMSVVGLASKAGCDFPVTQDQLADTVGLTPVHVNRVLQRMRSEGLIEIGSKHLAIREPEALQRVADFQSNYLHLDRRTA